MLEIILPFILFLCVASQTCSTQNGVDWGSGSIQSTTADSADACCSLCSSNSQCVVFTYDTSGTKACYLKNNFNSTSDNSNRVSGLRNGVTWQATIESKVLNTVTDDYLSFTMDWWPPSDTCEDGGHCWGNASILNANLNLPKLQTSAKQLSPIILRIGGTLEDQIIYEVGSTKCTDQSKCLNMTRWDQVISFAQSTGMLIVFGLNYLGQLTGSGGDWNPTNAKDFLQYTFDQYGSKAPMYGYELGNELDLAGETNWTRYGTAYSNLRSIVDSIWGSSPKPKIMGPACASTSSSYIVPAVQASKVDIFTYHAYPAGSGADSSVETKMLDPSFLNSAYNMAASVYNSVQVAQPNTPIWLGEGALCYGSGRANVSNRYEDSLWYLDQLGVLARSHHVTWARQTLIGGYYELVDHETINPNPDWWAAVLWKRLMGTTVLQADSPAEILRIYSHCTKNQSKSLTVLIINVDRNVKDPALHVQLNGISSLVPRDEYCLSTPSGNGESDQIALNNGTVLALGADGSMPALNPVTVTNSSQPIMIAPFTICFIVFPSAGISACP